MTAIAAAERATRLRAQSRARVAQFRAVADAGLAEGGVALGPLVPTVARDMGAEDDYLRFRGILYAAIRPIADTVAGQAVRVATVRRPGSRAGGRSIRSIRPVEGMTTAFWGETHDGREVLLPKSLKATAPDLDIHETHLALDLIEDPNPVMTDWHLKYLTIVNLIVTGITYWWHTKSATRRATNGHVLWPLPTSWVVPNHEKGPFSGWKVFPGGGITSVDAAADEIIMVHRPDPANLLGAKSAAQAQGRAIRTDEQIQMCQEALFSNGVFPRWAFLVGDPADEDGEEDGMPLLKSEQRLLVETAIAQKWATAARAGSPLVLDALIRDVKKLSNSVEEMDFPDSGQITYERITQGIGANPYVMGKAEPSSRAASAESRRHFGEFTLNPNMDLISKVLTKKFAPRFAGRNQKLAMWIEPYTPDDREERRKDWELAAKHQSVSRNELRAGMLGLGPIMDGETMAAPPTQVLMPVEPQKDAKKNGRKSLTASPETSAWAKAHKHHERQLQAVMLDFFLAQREDVQERFRRLAAAGGVEGLSGEAVAAEVFDRVDWDERLIEAVRPTCEAIMVDGALRELSPRRSKQMIEMSDLSPEVQAAMRADLETILTQNFSPHINATTRGKLVKTMSEGIAAGESEYELIVRIGDSPTVPGVTDGVLGSTTTVVRSANIARTETTGVLNGGHFHQQDELIRQGLIKGRRWSATADQYTRPEHLALHGVVAPGPDSPDGLFQLGGQRVPYPGHHSLEPGQRCNCILPGQLVQGRFVAGTKAWYEGPACEVITRSGRRLSVTPQHTVLTTEGFVPAGQLDKGDQIIGYQGRVDNPFAMPINGDNEYHRPAAIEQVFEALRSRAEMSSRWCVERVGIFSLDFHGDERFCHGDVEVVRPDGPLLFNGEPVGSQDISEDVLEGVNLGLPFVFSNGGVGTMPVATQHARGGFAFGGGSVPGSSALANDGSAVCLESAPFQGLCFGSASNLDVAFPEATKQDGAAVARLVAELLERFPGNVLLDQVVEVRYYEFADHVYDLQSVTGLIIAQDIGISNCRCTITAAF